MKAEKYQPSTQLQRVFLGSFFILVAIFLTQVILSHEGIESNKDSLHLTRKLLEQNRKLQTMQNIATQLKSDLGDLVRSSEDNPSDDLIGDGFERFQRAAHELRTELTRDNKDVSANERLTTLNVINEDMSRFVSACRKTFNERFGGDLRQASISWNEVYESHQLLINQIEELRDRLEVSQKNHILAQGQSLELVSTVQTVTGIVGIILLFFVILYGLVLAQKNSKYRKDLESTLVNLGKSQKEYKSAVERYDLAVAGTSQGIWEWNLISNEIQFSSRFLELLELTPDEDFKDRQLWLSQIHPEDFSNYCLSIQKHLKEHSPYEVEFRARNKRGVYKWFEERGQAVWREDGVPTRMVGFLTDINRRKESEAIIEQQQTRLMESLKSTSLSEMAKGMAQELFNPLKIIVGRAQQINDLKSKDAHDVALSARFATKIVEEADRIKRLITGFQTLTNDSSRNPMTPTNLADLLHDTLSFCRGRCKENHVRFTYKNTSPEATVNCRPTQISQVVLNLMNFAHDVMEPIQDRWITLKVTDVGKEVEIAFSFNARNLHEDLRKRVLGPRITRLQGLDGSSVALSLSRGMIEAHGGKFKIDGDSAHTRFLVLLPHARFQNSSTSAA